MSDYSAFFLMKPEDVKRYAVEVLHFFQPEEETDCVEIGDGNINYVFQVRSRKDGRSVIVKQADKLLRSSGRPLDLYRNKIEAETLMLEARLAPKFIPEVYHYDETMAALSMEDISAYKNLRKELAAGRVYGHLSENLSDFLVEHGQSTEIIRDTLDKVAGMFQSWLQDDPLSALSNVMERVAAAAVGVLNFIIGIIVMAYVLMSRDHFVGQGKKLLFALCRKRTTCDRILKHLRVINRIFTNFVSGKLLDSLIIGLLCAACLAILRIPYAGLISTIVGITNIIPVFGPFFGAIPSAFLLLLTDPYKCLVFLIFIVILQQVDGNIIGPKILGDSTGLSAFWVLFSLLLFNHLMGFWGMLLGVPLFASFYYLLREFINSRLKKKGLPLATQDYVHVAGIDENGTISYMPPPSIEFHPLLRGSNSLRAKIAQWLKHPTPPHRKSGDDTDRPDD